MTTAEERWLLDQSPVLTSYVAGLRRLGSRRFPHQVRKLYALCHEYEVAQVVEAAKRSTIHDLFDVKRLETMLLQEYGARLFAFKRGGQDEGPGSVTSVAAAAPPAEREEEQAEEKIDSAPELDGGNDHGDA
jgi:hypothetical protein